MMRKRNFFSWIFFQDSDEASEAPAIKKEPVLVVVQVDNREEVESCSKCGAENKKGGKFCSKCGNTFAIESAMQLMEEATVFCSKCSVENASKAKFCKKCGNNLQQ